MEYLEDLFGWLKTNKIKYLRNAEDVIELAGTGKFFVQNTDKMSSIFRKNKLEETEFALAEDADELLAEGIENVTFKFGKNWYWYSLKKGFALNILKYVGNRTEAEKKTDIVNLGVHSYFEMLNGSFSPAMWARKAKYCGHKALGFCDKNTMSGLYELQKACDANELTPVFGYSLVFNDGEQDIDAKVYVQTQEGLQNLLRIQKYIMVDSSDKKISLTELVDRGIGNVLVIGKNFGEWVVNNKHIISRFRKTYSEVYFQADLAEYKAERIDVKILESAKAYFDAYKSGRTDVEPILCTDCYYLDKDDAKNKIIVNKIAEGASHEQSEEQFYRDADDHFALFESLFDAEKWDIDEIFELCAHNAAKVAHGAEARFDTTRNYMPEYAMTEEEKEKYGTTHNMFCQLLEQGLNEKIPAEQREEYRKQMEYERYVIESTNNVDYLLVQYDTVNWARANGILVGCGRGSAAGSLLLYLLGITLVDPMKFGLIFERFLLPERAGLAPSQVTSFCSDIESGEYFEIEFKDGSKIEFDRDSEFIVKRGGETVKVFADELKIDDKIVFDNRDILFELPKKTRI